MAEEKKIEVVIPEPEIKEPEAGKEAELLAKKAEEEAGEAGEHKEETKEAKEEAEAAAKAATEAKEKTEKLTSYNEYAITGIKDSINLLVQRMEQVMTITKETAGEVKAINEELRTTLDLQQEQIGELDAATSKVVTAAAALVKLHKVTQEQE